MAANAPTRSSGTVVLQWGMIAIPTKIYSGTESNGVKRKEYALVDGEVVSVGRVYSVKETGEVIPYSEVFSGVQRDDGSIVEVTNEDMKSMLPMENGTAQVVCFVKQSAMFAGQYVLGDLRQARPDKGASKPFALLMAAMRRTQSFVICKMVLRNKAQYAALLPNGDFYTLTFDDDVRERLPMPEVEITSAEIEMGVQIVEQGLTTERPALVNDEDRALRDFIAGKEATADAPAAPLVTGDSDLMAALTAELAAGA